MKNKKTSSRSSLFLIELILSFLFLSLCTTVCIRIFAAAWENRKEAREWNHIQELTTNISEIFEASDGQAETIQSYLPSGTIDNDALLYYYNSAWNSTDPESAAYILKLKPDISSLKKTLQIQVLSSGTENTILYKTEVSYPLFSFSAKEVLDEKAE